MVCGLPFLIALLCSNAATHRRLVFAVLAISVFAWIVPGTLWLYPAPLNDFGSTVAEWIQFARAEFHGLPLAYWRSLSTECVKSNTAGCTKWG